MVIFGFDKRIKEKASICTLTVFLCRNAKSCGRILFNEMLHAIQMFLNLTLVFIAGVFVLASESLFCSAELGEDKL